METSKPTVRELDAILASPEARHVEIQTDGSIKAPSFREALESLINRYSRENESNTPDWILATFMHGCLMHFEGAVRERDKWYSISPEPGWDGKRNEGSTENG